MHAKILEILKDHLIGKTRALDLGSGSGYFTTLMATLMNGGFVYGLDNINELVYTSIKNINK